MIFHRLETFLHIVAITHLGGKGGKGDHSSVKMGNVLIHNIRAYAKTGTVFLEFS